jgi:hypothetical protein
MRVVFSKRKGHILESFPRFRVGVPERRVVGCAQVAPEPVDDSLHPHKFD